MTQTILPPHLIALGILLSVFAVVQVCDLQDLECAIGPEAQLAPARSAGLRQKLAAGASPRSCGGTAASAQGRCRAEI
jgi:hypothetical protein